MDIRNQKIIAIVTGAEDKGTYGQIRFTTTRLLKNTNEKKKSFFSFWNVAGSGYEGFDKLIQRLEDAPTFDNSDKKMGVMIVIKSFSMTQEQYEKDGEKLFSKTPFYTIWDWDFYNSKDSDDGEKKSKVKKSDKKMDTPPEVDEAEFEDEAPADDEDDVFGED